LAYRDHSTAELFRKLHHDKDFNEVEVHAALLVLQQEGLLNDARFTENFIRYRCSKGYGPVRIRAELLERGVAQNLIEQHLQIADNVWLDKVRKVWDKRFKGSLPQDFRARAQQMRFLQYRGFTTEQINSIFNSDA
jgi:regulatory protein